MTLYKPPTLMTFIYLYPGEPIIQWSTVKEYVNLLDRGKFHTVNRL